MAGSGEAPEATKWRRTSKFYRRPPGLPWLIGLVVIPLLLAVISYGEPGRTRPEATGPAGALPTLIAPAPLGGSAEHADNSGGVAGPGVTWPNSAPTSRLR